jgi:hypothetical protein
MPIAAPNIIIKGIEAAEHMDEIQLSESGGLSKSFSAFLMSRQFQFITLNELFQPLRTLIKVLETNNV